MFANPSRAARTSRRRERMANGCACCTAGVMFRVASVRAAARRPARWSSIWDRRSCGTLEAQLQGGSLARALRVVGRVDLDAHAEAHA
jgi:hypothetical protein